MIESRESQLVTRLVEYLKSDEVQLGERLLAERKLAEILHTSRNTLRNALKMLQARGILNVKANSGYYLTIRPGSEADSDYLNSQQTLPWISDQLEALIIFEPVAVGMAAERMTDTEIKSLETCMVSLSKAILENNTRSIVSNHKKFHEIIAAGTHNHSIARMLERLVVTYELISDLMHRIEQEKRDKIFALHVNLFKAVSSRDIDKAQTESREMIKYLTILLNEYEGVRLPDKLKDSAYDIPGGNNW
jgi:GntR family transcriptional repressor for pyruvate dehydrogenase complex